MYRSLCIFTNHSRAKPAEAIDAPVTRLPLPSDRLGRGTGRDWSASYHTGAKAFSLLKK